ncbi:hypothetical protein [Bradyrhizobium sp. BR 1433]|uniref:hypothetical protein n=1 Tax=Bradyrhizobium sp. BR 1433 TaxID=3447967 RepID=UPI003EE7F72C
MEQVDERMTADELLSVLRAYSEELDGIVRRFVRKPNSVHIHRDDEARFRKLAGEVIDLFNDFLPRLRYAPQLAHDLQEGTVYGSPSLHCVSQFSTVVSNAVVRLQRSPDELMEKGRRQVSCGFR